MAFYKKTLVTKQYHARKAADLNSRHEVGEDDGGQGFELDGVPVFVVALESGNDHPHQVQCLVLAHVVAQVQRALK